MAAVGLTSALVERRYRKIDIALSMLGKLFA